MVKELSHVESTSFQKPSSARPEMNVEGEEKNWLTANCIQVYRGLGSSNLGKKTLNLAAGQFNTLDTYHKITEVKQQQQQQATRVKSWVQLHGSSITARG